MFSAYELTYIYLSFSWWKKLHIRFALLYGRSVCKLSNDCFISQLGLRWFTQPNFKGISGWLNPKFFSGFANHRFLSSLERVRFRVWTVYVVFMKHLILVQSTDIYFIMLVWISFYTECFRFLQLLLLTPLAVLLQELLSSNIE